MKQFGKSWIRSNYMGLTRKSFEGVSFHTKNIMDDLDVNVPFSPL